MFEWQESHKPVFPSAVLPYESKTFLTEREQRTCLNIKAAVWKGSWAARVNNLSFQICLERG